MMAPIKIKTRGIPENGLTLSQNFDPEGMNLQTQNLRFTQPVRVRASFQKERDVVTVQVEASADREMTCARCLAVYHALFDGRFDLGYDVKNKPTLDITDDVRQEILLSYPVTFLCREDCKGLCPRCGQNLNEKRCACTR